MIRLAFVIVIYFLLLPIARGQNHTLDSLASRLSITKNITVRADLLHRLSVEIRDYDLSKSLSYAQQSQELSQQINYTKGTVLSITDQGVFYFLRGDYRNAANHYREAIRLSSSGNSDYFPATTFIQAGDLFLAQAMFDSARYYYNVAGEYLKNQDDPKQEARLLHSVGMLQYELSDYFEAKLTFKRSLSLHERFADSLAISESYKALGQVYLGLDNFDSAQFFLQKVKGLADRLNNPELSIFYNLYQGRLNFKKGEFILATSLLAKALDSLSQNNFPRYYSLALKNMGQIFEWQGDYQRALEYFFSALEVEENLNSRLEIARIYDRIGWVYANQKNFTNAQLFATASRRIFRLIKDDFGQSDYFSLSGYIAFQQGKYERALQYYDSSLAIRKWFDAKIPMAHTLNYMVQVYIAQGRYDEASKQSNRIYEINMQVGNRDGVANYFNNMSEIEWYKDNYAGAKRYALQALAESKAIGATPALRKAIFNLSRINSRLGNYPLAIEFYERYIQISDSLYNAESVMRQAQLNALYQLDKREEHIAELNQQNAVQKATLQVQQNRIKFQNSVLIFSIVALILLIIIAYVLYMYYRNKNKANYALNLLNKEVTEKSEKIHAQSAELVEANEGLKKLNYELVEKQEEIEAQSEELREANQIINEINRDLEGMVTKRTFQLQEAYKELDTFFYRSSHDFRRPLTTFMGLSEVAKVTVKDAYALELFSKVKETARNLDKMLVKLQSISDVGSQEMVYKPVFIKEITDNVFDAFREEIDLKGIIIHNDISLASAFVSYPAMVKIIIENLIENAIQFSSPLEPYICFKAVEDMDTMVIEVKDNGQGIGKEYISKIFDMYFRASDRSRGNGLGLYIIKKAVSKLGGNITVESQENLGSTFTVILPKQ